jgi:hypothetical protein
MNWKGFGRKLPLYYPEICLEGLRETTKILTQDSLSPGWDSKRIPLEYKSRDTSRPACSVVASVIMNLAQSHVELYPRLREVTSAIKLQRGPVFILVYTYTRICYCIRISICTTKQLRCLHVLLTLLGRAVALSGKPLESFSWGDRFESPTGNRLSWLRFFGVSLSPSFDSRRYQIFCEVVGLERGPLTGELLEWKSSYFRSRKPRLTAVGICCADHATHSIRKSWH